MASAPKEERREAPGRGGGAETLVLQGRTERGTRGGRAVGQGEDNGWEGWEGKGNTRFSLI